MASQTEALRLTHEGQGRWERNDREGYEALWADDATWTNSDGEDTYRGPKEICDYLWGFRDAWADDVHLDISREFGDDTQCVTVGRFTGTNTGSIPTPTGPLPATGKNVDLLLCQVITVQDGKVTSVLNCNTLMYSLVQLGLAPAAEGVPA
jgi:ketosteroid isomerase-like protein